MFSGNSTQIMALIRRGKLVNIGGRPVLGPKSNPQGSAGPRGDQIKVMLAFAAIYLVWGSTYLAIRYAVETIPPLITAGIRHTVAGGVLLAWALARGYRPRREHWVAGAVVGAFYFLICHGSLHWAEQHVNSGMAALLTATEPMFILLLAWASGQQKVSRTSALGLAVGAVGIAILTAGELSAKGSSLLGLIAVLVGALSWAAGVVVSPKLKLPEEAIARTAVPLVCGAAMLLATRRHHGRIPRSALVGGFLTFDPWAGVPDFLWLDRCLHSLHMVVAAVPTDSGSDAHVCQSSGGCSPGMAARV